MILALVEFGWIDFFTRMSFDNEVNYVDTRPLVNKITLISGSCDRLDESFTGCQRQGHTLLKQKTPSYELNYYFTPLAYSKYLCIKHGEQRVFFNLKSSYLS